MNLQGNSINSGTRMSPRQKSLATGMTPAELCSHIALCEISAAGSVFDVKLDGRSLTVQFSMRSAENLSRYDVEEGMFLCRSDLDAYRWAKSLRTQELKFVA